MHAYFGGRGSGKTRAAAEWIVAECLQNPGLQAGVLAMDWDAFFGVCVNGRSGIMSIIPDESIAELQIGRKRVVFANGSHIQGFTSEKPKKLRGPQFHRFWIDEPVDLWNATENFSNARGAIRLPEYGIARTMITGTPRNTPIMEEIMRLHAADESKYTISRGSMSRNVEHLDPAFVEEMYTRYPKGSTYYKQEIEGELVTEAEGAIWRSEWITHCDDSFDATTTAIGIDPADSAAGDECGIIVGSSLRDRTVRILADETLNASMLEWVERIPRIADDYGASTLVVESNFAGATLATLLKDVATRSNLSIKWVQAKGDKATRARPVAALYEAGIVKHANEGLSKLENEMLLWEPSHSRQSPNRIDACVHLVNALRFDASGGGSSFNPYNI